MKQAGDEPPTDGDDKPPKIVIFYIPSDVNSRTRSHEVERAYLIQHRGSTSYNIPERDVETWLSLQTPGTLWQTNPANRYGWQPRLNIQRDGEDGSAQYKFPLRGGRFEATEPAADLYPTINLPSCTYNDDTRPQKGEHSLPPIRGQEILHLSGFMVKQKSYVYIIIVDTNQEPLK